MHLMRQIEVEIKPEWERLKSSDKSCQPFEDCEPNMLRGWTDKNPSILDVSDNTGKPTLEQILVALCRRKKEDWEKIAYIKFDGATVDKSKLQLSSSNGNTGDQRVDMSKIHFEVKGITAKQLSTLIYYIIQDDFQTGIFKKSDFQKILVDAYDKTLTTQVQMSSTSPNNTTTIPLSGTMSEDTTGKIIEREEKKPLIATSSTK